MDRHGIVSYAAPTSFGVRQGAARPSGLNAGVKMGTAARYRSYPFRTEPFMKPCYTHYDKVAPTIYSGVCSGVVYTIKYQ